MRYLAASLSTEKSISLHVTELELQRRTGTRGIVVRNDHQEPKSLLPHQTVMMIPDAHNWVLSMHT